MKLTIFLSNKNEKEFKNIYEYIKDNFSADVQCILMSHENTYSDFEKDILLSDVILLVVPTLVKETDIHFLKSISSKIVIWGFSELISKMNFANFTSLSLPEIMNYLLIYKNAIENPLENVESFLREKASLIMNKEIINIYYCKEEGVHKAILDDGKEIEIKLE